MKKKGVISKVDKKSFWCATCLDVAFTKISVFFFTLFLVYLLPQYFGGLDDWKWAFLVISLVFGIKPLRSFLKK